MPHYMGAPRTTKLDTTLSSRVLRGKDDPDIFGVGRRRGQPAPDASPLRLAQHDTFGAMTSVTLTWTEYYSWVNLIWLDCLIVRRRLNYRYIAL